MLQVSEIRENIEAYKQALKKRGFDQERLQSLDQTILLDDQRKSLQTSLDQKLAAINSHSKEIGMLYKSGKASEANALKTQVSDLKTEAAKEEDAMKLVKEELYQVLLTIPNIPHDSVPDGLTEDDNEVYQDWSTDLPDLGAHHMPHWELADKYNLIDFKLGVKITGSGFPLYRGQGAKLQRALIQFFLDEAVAAGYEEVMPPLLVNADSARGTGQLPDKEGQMYEMERDGLYLIPTAEVPLTNIYRDVILKESDFPQKVTGHTPCFRREAGSYGSDVKGLNRVHQFEKIEIVQIAHPEKSYDVLEEMLRHIESLLVKLELPYRILRLCGGDLTFTSALTFDFEVYSAAQKKWLEVSSVSNFLTYQSNRLKLRYKGDNGKTQLAHTLNGSALALARIVAALLENNQTADGIKIPEALKPYTGFDVIK